MFIVVWLFTLITSLCMYVCMSENLYPARLKRKRYSRAAVSNKQKRLQCPFEPFRAQVGWAQRGREAVPDPGSSDSKTPITECTVGASNNEHHSIRRWYSYNDNTSTKYEQGTTANNNTSTDQYSCPKYSIFVTLQKLTKVNSPKSSNKSSINLCLASCEKAALFCSQRNSKW